MNADKVAKYLSDAIPVGEHPAPHNEWIAVRLDVVIAAIDLVSEIAEDMPLDSSERSALKRIIKWWKTPAGHTGTAQSEGWP